MQNRFSQFLTKAKLSAQVVWSVRFCCIPRRRLTCRSPSPGFHHALGWVLPTCAALGVLMQARKVDAFCQNKYGAAWERYAARVRHRLIPSVF